MYNFFAYMSRMKLIRRWSLMKAVTEENIAEHSAQVAQIAHALAVIANRIYGKTVNADRVATLALYHESSEVITGDLPTPIKYYNPEIRDAYKSIEGVANGKLLSMLPEDANLGLYECPYPYKRLVTPKILKWCIETGRFYYMKDTCCDADLIKERLDILKGTHFNLLNANCQTLLQSLKDGGAGYCGIMANFHPELYSWLCENYEKEQEKAEVIQNLLGTCGFTENGLPYPLTAKYHMCLEGIETALITRKPDGGNMSDYAKDCVKQLRMLSKYFEAITED